MSNWMQAPDVSYVGGSEGTMAPDGTHVGGSTWTIAPDGTYVGGSNWLVAPDGRYVGVDCDQCRTNDQLALFSGSPTCRSCAF